MYGVTNRVRTVDWEDEETEAKLLEKELSSVEQVGPVAKEAPIEAESESCKGESGENLSGLGTTQTKWCPTHQDHIIDGKCNWCESIGEIVKADTIRVISGTRSGKKLLVIDPVLLINEQDTFRPFLHEFLSSVYKNFDLALWSNTDMGSLIENVDLFTKAKGTSCFKIAFILCGVSLLDVTYKEQGFTVKSLEVIWARFPQYSRKNTVIIEGELRSFLLNTRSGLRMTRFDFASDELDADTELMKLCNYLHKISKFKDFSKEIVCHSSWDQRYGNVSQGN